jgi:octaprenyl-diphosphate synthase
MTTGAPNRTTGLEPKDPAAVFSCLAPHMARLDGFLHEQLSAFEPELRAIVGYCLENSGKRIRPSLVFFSGWDEAEVVSEQLVKVAAVVEMIHMATLVHDDIMDGADLRRQRLTVARKFGPDAAVLLGDALFAHALNIAAGFPTTEVCRCVAAATRTVCSGEIMQTLDENEAQRTISTYRRIIEMKTAELFSVSCFLGARHSSGGDDFSRAAECFGRHLGIAYQIYDDLADFFGSESDIGKTLGTDLASGKPTLPLLLLLERLPVERAQSLQMELESRNADNLADHVEQMRDHKVLTDVIEEIRSEIRSGIAALRPWHERPAVVLLSQLARLLESKAELLAEK